jgi:hypothetical protein
MKYVTCCIHICVLVCITTPLFAGSEDKTDAIIAYTEIMYTKSIDADILRDPVKGALHEGISQERITRFISANMQAGVEIEELIFYLELITSTQAEGLPSYLVMNTILEGFAKGATGEEIRTSLMTRRSHLQFCHRVAVHHNGRGRRNTDDTNLISTALYNALHMGFAESTLEQLSSSIREHQRSSVFFMNSLEVLMELHSLGLENEQSASLIDSAIAMDYRIGNIRSFPQIFSTQLKNGMSQDDIFAVLREDIEHLRAFSFAADNGSPRSGSNRSSDGPGSDRSSPSQRSAPSSGAKKGKGNGGG